MDYLLYFRKDSGKKVVFNATEDLFNRFEKGDRAEKTKGQYYPVRIEN